MNSHVVVDPQAGTVGVSIHASQDLLGTPFLKPSCAFLALCILMPSTGQEKHAIASCAWHQDALALFGRPVPSDATFLRASLAQHRTRYVCSAVP